MKNKNGAKKWNHIHKCDKDVAVLQQLMIDYFE